MAPSRLRPDQTFLAAKNPAPTPHVIPPDDFVPIAMGPRMDHFRVRVCACACFVKQDMKAKRATWRADSAGYYVLSAYSVT